MSPPLKQYITFEWHDTYFTYTLDTQTTPGAHTDHITLDNVDAFEYLHRHLYGIIHDWCLDPAQNNNHIARLWRRALKQGITKNSSWSQVQQIMTISTYEDYYHHITQCPNIKQAVALQYDRETKQVTYCCKTSQQPTTTNVFDTPVIRNHNAHSNDPALHLTMPKLSSQDQPLPSTIENWEPNPDPYNFEYLHMIVYITIERWTTHDTAKHHKFYSEWQKAKYNGLKTIENWEHVTQTLNIHSHEQYIMFVNQCPEIPRTLQLHWDPYNHIIRYGWRQPPTTSAVEQEHDHMHTRYNSMQPNTTTLGNVPKDINNLIQKFETSLECHKRSIDTQIEKGSHVLSTQLNVHIKTFMEKANAKVSQISEQIKTTMDQNLQQVQNAISQFKHTAIIDMEHQINDGHLTIHNSIKEGIEHATETIQKVFQHTTQDNSGGNSKYKSTRFPNADPALYKDPPMRRNPYDLPSAVDHITASQQEDHHTSDDEWDRYGPNDDHECHVPKPLPSLLSYKMVNHIKLPYSGIESSYTWYRNLRSAIQEFGVLLLNIEDFKPDKSLCPKTYYGTKVDTTRYRDMANALYQLLALQDTVPPEHTEIRNIINRYSKNTDGYSALYEIMERTHPLLNPDAKLHPPSSTDCSDIHEYYNQLDSFFLYAKLKDGRQFTPRSQVHMFLDGLDASYAPAIRHIRQDMRAWKKSEHTPPDDLIITALATTVDRIMREEDNIPTIRALSSTTKRLATYTPKNIKPMSQTNRQYIDIQCNWCKAYGHKKMSCDKMAAWLLLHEHSTQLDEKTKTKLIDNYLKSVSERRNKRLQRLKGTVRQLYADGHIDQADAMWDQCMSCTITQDSDDDESTTSQE